MMSTHQRNFRGQKLLDSLLPLFHSGQVTRQYLPHQTGPMYLMMAMLTTHAPWPLPCLTPQSALISRFGVGRKLYKPPHGQLRLTRKAGKTRGGDRRCMCWEHIHIKQASSQISSNISVGLPCSGMFPSMRSNCSPLEDAPCFF